MQYQRKLLLARLLSEHGGERHIHIELHRDLTEPATNGHYLAETRVKIISQHHWPRILQVKMRSIRHSGASENAQFVARRNVLHDAGHAGNSEVTEYVGSMAAVVENQSVLRVDGIQEVAAESHGEPDDTDEIARGRIVRDVLRLQ